MATDRTAESVAQRPLLVVVSSDDPRSAKALALAEQAGQWLKCRAKDGRKFYGVPSQRQAGVYYLTDCRACTCPDFERRQLPCKHVLAVRLHVARKRAEKPRPTVTPLRIAAEKAQRTAEMAAKYASIFGSDA